MHEDQGEDRHDFAEFDVFEAGAFQMTEIAPVYPATGAPVRRDQRPMTLTYRGESLTFPMLGWYCDSSEESVHTGEDMKVSDRMLNRLKSRVERLLDPEEIRRIRKKLGLTQVQAGELIGGGPRAFQKYETGDLLPSRAISSALTLLDNDPAAFGALNGRPSPPLGAAEA